MVLALIIIFFPFVMIGFYIGWNGWYKKLYDSKYFMINFIISLFLVFLSFLFIHLKMFIFPKGYGSCVFIVPFVFLLLFQISRQIVLKIKNREFIFALNYTMDLEDKKNKRDIDTILTMLIFFFTGIITFLFLVFSYVIFPV
jgi:hypothetical protein